MIFKDLDFFQLKHRYKHTAIHSQLHVFICFPLLWYCLIIQQQKVLDLKVQKSFLADLKKRKTEVRLDMVMIITCEKYLPFQDIELYVRHVDLIEQDIKSIEVSYQLIMYPSRSVNVV